MYTIMHQQNNEWRQSYYNDESLRFIINEQKGYALDALMFTHERTHVFVRLG